MLVPFNASGASLGPVGELQKAAMSRGVSLFCHWNVMLVVPPITTPEDELRQGLAVIDEVLEIADRAAAA